MESNKQHVFCEEEGLMNRETLWQNLRILLASAKNAMRDPDFILIDGATWEMLMPDPEHWIGIDPGITANGKNMSGDAFIEGKPVVFVDQAGIRLGYRRPF